MKLKKIPYIIPLKKFVFFENFFATHKLYQCLKREFRTQNSGFGIFDQSLS